MYVTTNGKKLYFTLALLQRDQTMTHDCSWNGLRQSGTITAKSQWVKKQKVQYIDNFYSIVD